ncbi:hypothetical protein CAPN005_00420 [Capnocytophaga cynodegmi]|nr:hypothetical protein CAPN005_00420 [Capnocytophaga cynodegmi]
MTSTKNKITDVMSKTYEEKCFAYIADLLLFKLLDRRDIFLLNFETTSQKNLSVNNKVFT